MTPRETRSHVVLLLSICSFLFLGGCVTIEPDDYERLMSTQRFTMDHKNLTPTKLKKYMDEIDHYYAEPRTPKKVELSLETAELSISSVNHYGSLWRGSRACYWLAMNLPDHREREKFARKGVAMGRAAITNMTTRPEPYYYAALNLGAFCSIVNDRGYIPAVSLLREARDNAKMTVALEERYDFGGAHRLLGKLMTESAGVPVYQIGSFEEGLDHLKRAVDLSPEFAQNHLFLAQAYKDDNEFELARTEIDEVFRSSIPPDYTVEHRQWLQGAVELGAKLPRKAGIQSAETASVD